MDGNTPEKEHRLTFQEMAQELEKYRQILETASDGFVTVNANHEIIYLNRAAERIFGFKRQEVLGSDLDVLLPPEYVGRHRRYVERYARTGRPHIHGQRIEVEAVRRDGTRFPASLGFSAAEVGSGMLFTARIRDLSEQRGLAEKVRQSQRLAMLGRMVAMVGHEIRTPLVLIGGFASQVLKDPGLSPKSRHKLSVVLEEVARLEALLDELRDLSSPNTYQWREVDLTEVVGRVAELIRPSLGEQEIVLEIESPDDLPMVLADADRLSQVFINLISNAAQASSPGSRVLVRLELRPGDGILCRVMDQGKGISPRDLRHVMEPFYTTRDRGTGLGLPVALRIVEEHGGTLKLTSQLDQGTTAEVFLPLPRASAQPPASPQA